MKHKIKFISIILILIILLGGFLFFLYGSLSFSRKQVKYKNKLKLICESNKILYANPTLIYSDGTVKTLSNDTLEKVCFYLSVINGNAKEPKKPADITLTLPKINISIHILSEDSGIVYANLNNSKFCFKIKKNYLNYFFEKLKTQ